MKKLNERQLKDLFAILAAKNIPVNLILKIDDYKSLINVEIAGFQENAIYYKYKNDPWLNAINIKLIKKIEINF